MIQAKTKSQNICRRNVGPGNVDAVTGTGGNVVPTDPFGCPVKKFLTISRSSCHTRQPLLAHSRKSATLTRRPPLPSMPCLRHSKFLSRSAIITAPSKSFDVAISSPLWATNHSTTTATTTTAPPKFVAIAVPMAEYRK